MNKLLLFSLLAFLAILLPVSGSAAETAPPAEADRSRVFVLTDISNDPDDEQSLVRLLVYANEYDIEGIVATTSTWLRDKTREDLIRRQLDAYGQVRDNLLRHAPGFPTKEALLDVVATGQPRYGMEAVGDGKTAYIMEGDTPSFLGLIRNGLGWHVSPAYGGWGGRCVLYQAYGESRPIWTNNHDSRDTVTADNGRTVCSDQATIWRWREHFQHDFAARMDWCVAERYEDANHNPIAVLNGDATKRVLEISAAPGETVRFSAAGSSDPDGDQIAYRWFIYREAGSFTGELSLSHDEQESIHLVAPRVDRPVTIHVILQLEDNGSPSLFTNRRAMVTVSPGGK